MKIASVLLNTLCLDQMYCAQYSGVRVQLILKVKGGSYENIRESLEMKGEHLICLQPFLSSFRELVFAQKLEPISVGSLSCFNLNTIRMVHLHIVKHEYYSLLNKLLMHLL